MTSIVYYNHGFAVISDALAIIRAHAGETVRLIASHRDASAPSLRAADIAIIEPYPIADEDYLAWCLDLCATHKVDLFLAQTRARMLSDYVADFAAIGTQLLVAGDRATLDLIDDKARFYPAAITAGLPMPQTIEVTTAAQFDAACAALTAAGHEPCIKPPIGIYGAGYWRLNDEKDLFHTLMHPGSHVTTPALIRQALDARHGEARLLVMEYLPGEEWSVDALLDNGRWITGVARAKRGRYQHLVTQGPVIDLARRCFAPFALSGMNNLQFRVGSGGGGSGGGGSGGGSSGGGGSAGPDDLRLLEINARMSGGCHYAKHAGAALPWWQVALALGLMSEEQLPQLAGGAIVTVTKRSEPVAPLVVASEAEGITNG